MTDETEPTTNEVTKVEMDNGVTIFETDNFGVVDEGDHLKVYKKSQDMFEGDEYFVKIAELYRTVFEEEA